MQALVEISLGLSDLKNMQVLGKKLCFKGMWMTWSHEKKGGARLQPMEGAKKPS